MSKSVVNLSSLFKAQKLKNPWHISVNRSNLSSVRELWTRSLEQKTFVSLKNNYVFFLRLYHEIKFSCPCLIMTILESVSSDFWCLKTVEDAIVASGRQVCNVDNNSSVCCVKKKKDFGEQFPTMGYSDILDSWSSPNSSNWVAINFLYNTTNSLVLFMQFMLQVYIINAQIYWLREWWNYIYIYKYIMNPFS